MEVKAKDHDAKNIVDAFLGEDRLERIQEDIYIFVETAFKEASKDNEAYNSPSKIIEKACHLWADTPGEAIGIALYVNETLELFEKELAEYQVSKALKGFDKVMGSLEKLKKSLTDADELPDAIIQTLIPEHIDCDPENCIIKKQALKRKLI